MILRILLLSMSITTNAFALQQSLSREQEVHLSAQYNQIQQKMMQEKAAALEKMKRDEQIAQMQAARNWRLKNMICNDVTVHFKRSYFDEVTPKECIPANGFIDMNNRSINYITTKLRGVDARHEELHDQTLTSMFFKQSQTLLRLPQQCKNLNKVLCAAICCSASSIRDEGFNLEVRIIPMWEQIPFSIPPHPRAERTERGTKPLQRYRTPSW